jgi:hypothetical protein
MGVVGNRGIFRRHAEGVPPHGVQHVESAHALVAGHDIADGVVAHMPHVDFAGRIGKHFQQIIFFPVRRILDIEQR